MYIYTNIYIYIYVYSLHICFVKTFCFDIYVYIYIYSNMNLLEAVSSGTQDNAVVEEAIPFSELRGSYIHILTNLFIYKFTWTPSWTSFSLDVNVATLQMKCDTQYIIIVNCIYTHFKNIACCSVVFLFCIIYICCSLYICIYFYM